MPDYFAYGREGRPPEEWQLIEEHLKNAGTGKSPEQIRQAILGN